MLGLTAAVVSVVLNVVMHGQTEPARFAVYLVITATITVSAMSVSSFVSTIGTTAYAQSVNWFAPISGTLVSVASVM